MTLEGLEKCHPAYTVGDSVLVIKWRLKYRQMQTSGLPSGNTPKQTSGIERKCVHFKVARPAA